MAQNRDALHVLADAAGITYEQAKGWLYMVSFNHPSAVTVTRDLVEKIEKRAIKNA